MTLTTDQENVLKLLKKSSPRSYSDLNRRYFPAISFTREVLLPLIDAGLIEAVKSMGCVNSDSWASRNCGFRITDAGRAILEPTPVKLEPETTK
jgi:hypothetical protein